MWEWTKSLCSVILLLIQIYVYFYVHSTQIMYVHKNNCKIDIVQNIHTHARRHTITLLHVVWEEFVCIKRTLRYSVFIWSRFFRFFLFLPNGLFPLSKWKTCLKLLVRDITLLDLFFLCHFLFVCFSFQRICYFVCVFLSHVYVAIFIFFAMMAFTLWCGCKSMAHSMRMYGAMTF